MKTFICSDRKDECIIGVDGVVCLHHYPHGKVNECSHKRFRCKQFSAKQHRCKKFKPEKSNFQCLPKNDTFTVIGYVLDAELLRLIEKYGTQIRGRYPEDCVAVSLPHWLFNAFAAGMV